MTKDERIGWLSGFSAYLLWGVFPLYFVLFQRTGALEVVAHRIVWSFVFCMLLLVALRGVRRFVGLWRDRRTALLLAAAGVLITLNWSLYVIGVLSGRTIEAALGYFINPLAAVAFGVVVFRERLRLLQKVALVFGALAVVVMVVAYGQVPWIALGLAASFASYSVVKKLVGAKVQAVDGLASETAVMVPLALGYLLFLAVRGAGSFSLSGYGALLATTGVVTAVPLLLFAVAARSIPMVGIGMLQYQSPVWQFLIGWLVFGEPMPASRWAGFVLVWIAIAVFIADIVLVVRAHRRALRS